MIDLDEIMEIVKDHGTVKHEWALALCDGMERLRKRIDLMEEYWDHPEMLCEVVGCEREVTSGVIRADGGYWHVCSEHWGDYNPFKRKAQHEYIGGRTAQEVGYE